jgi:hypothetical protein
MTVPPAYEQIPNGGSQKPRRTELWAFAMGLLILVALLGHLVNQQRASKQPANANDGVEPVPGPTTAETNTAVETKTEAPQQNPTPRNPAPPKRSQVVYSVRHKHRLRDCHGTLTFTQEGLRFESDEPQDSFAVRLDEVTVEGGALRIRDKTWRFELDDGTSAERIFEAWKTGTLRPGSSR